MEKTENNETRNQIRGISSNIMEILRKMTLYQQIRKPR